MILQLVLRNLRIYFRDKASVFFSLLGVFVIIGLYVLFLGDLIVSQYEDMLPGFRFVMDSWIMSGVIAAASITTTMGAFGIMVDDTAKKIIKDFKVAPISRWKLVLGYILSSVIIGVLMSLITLVLGELYIVGQGGEFLSFVGFLETIGLICLSVTASSALVFFMVSFIKSANAFSTASTLIGTLIGFFMGVYVAIGNLPSGVQLFIKCFPIAHSGVLLRQVMMGEAIDKVIVPIIDQIDPNLFDLEGFRISLGVDFMYGDWMMPSWMHVLVLVLTALIFYGLTIVVVSKRKAKE
jgi:multidrug/hemolysin transport system permease protein